MMQALTIPGAAKDADTRTYGRINDFDAKTAKKIAQLQESADIIDAAAARDNTQRNCGKREQKAE